MKYTLHSFHLLVTYTHIAHLMIDTICVILQDCVFNQIQSPSSYTPPARTAHTRIPLRYSKRYGRILKNGLLLSRSTDSPLQIMWYISGSWVSHRASFLLLLWCRFLSPFLFSTIMSLNRHYQQSGWIVYLGEYLPGYRQSLKWRVAWHLMCGI